MRTACYAEENNRITIHCIAKSEFGATTVNLMLQGMSFQEFAMSDTVITGNVCKVISEFIPIPSVTHLSLHLVFASWSQS